MHNPYLLNPLTHWLHQTQQPVGDEFRPLHIFGHDGLMHEEKLLKVLSDPQMAAMMTKVAHDVWHGKAASDFFDAMRERFVFHGLIEDKEVEPVLLANMWKDPEDRDLPATRIDLTLCKALGLASDKISCLMTEGGDVILALRHDKKYGAELDATVSGNKIWDESWQKNLMREAEEEAGIDLEPHMPQVRHHGYFISRRHNNGTSCARGRHAITTFEKPADVVLRTTAENLAYVRVPVAALERQLLTPRENMLAPYLASLDPELRGAKMKFNLPPHILMAFGGPDMNAGRRIIVQQLQQGHYGPTSAINSPDRPAIREAISCAANTKA